jgi:hypothetical protein
VVGIRRDLEAEQRRTLTFEVTVLDALGVNPDTGLAGWTGHMQIRAARDASAALLADATVTIEPTTGVVTAVVAASALDDDWASGQYDLYIADGAGRVESLAWGTVRLARRVTT